MQKCWLQWLPCMCSYRQISPGDSAIPIPVFSTCSRCWVDLVQPLKICRSDSCGRYKLQYSVCRPVAASFPENLHDVASWGVQEATQRIAGAAKLGEDTVSKGNWRFAVRIPLAG